MSFAKPYKPLEDRVNEDAEQPAQQEPVAWRDHVEQRLLTWRQSFVNKSGDQLALDDFMDKRSLDDLIDFVCSEYTSPPAQQQEKAPPEQWRERWYGSLAEKGWWICCGREHIAHLGTEVSSDEVRKIVDAHNRYKPAALQKEPAQQQEPEYKGWYCAHCQRGVDSSEVTYHEQHTVCGRVITDDVPPKAQQQEPVAWLIDNDYTTVFRDIAEAHRNKGANVEPLYTSPPAQRKPLTDEVKHEFWIEAINHGKNGQSMNWQKAADFYADAIEAAHGIKEKNT